MTAQRSLTSTEVLAAATVSLVAGGYRRIDTTSEDWGIPNSRLFEDEYGLVAVVVYETWEALAAEWVVAQGALVELISRHLSRSHPKSWEGYLVALTPGSRGRSGRQEWMNIRYNTNRLRKLVASGEELRAIADVETALAPLLPVDSQAVTVDLFASVLDLVPDLVHDSSGLPRKVAQEVVNAFVQQRNMLEALHNAREGGE